VGFEDYLVVPFQVVRRIYDIGELGMTSIRMFPRLFPTLGRGLRIVSGGRGMA
jgi:hypothetical protein